MSRSYVLPASFRPPAVPDPAGASRARPCVLLDPVGYFADGENATTAQAETSKGQVVKVSFTLADPPAVSYLCVQCPGMEIDDFLASVTEAMKPSLTKLMTASPTLLLLDYNVVYMASKVSCDDPRAWMIAIDMRTKEMVQMSLFSAHRERNVTVNYHPFCFSSYLNAT